MRLSITVLVAIQAWMGLAHAIPFSPSEYHGEEEKRETFRDLVEKHGIDSSIESPRPETDKHESKEHHGDFKYRLKHYYPDDHEHRHGYSLEEKYEPKGSHTITNVEVRKYYPHEYHEHEDDYDYKDKYSNLEDDYGYNSYRPEKHHREHKEDYEAREIDALDDHYGLTEQDFDKYFIRDLHDHSEKYEPEESEYDVEDDPYHHIDGVDQFHSKVIYNKRDYDEDRDQYHDDDEGEHPKHDPSPKEADGYGAKGLYGFKHEYHPEEKSFLSEEAFEKLRHGDSDQRESISYEKYFQGYDQPESVSYKKDFRKEEKKEKSYHNEAEKYGYRKYNPEEEDDKHKHSSGKRRHVEEENDKADYTEENGNQVFKQLHYPPYHERTESHKFYRKQEVGDDDHKSNDQPHPQKKGDHHGYYKEPGYEDVIPGFMWAGPGTVTKTPCAKREGCPHGHWHMLEPKNGEHRRIGMTGTNIVVEPDYTRPDYKEDTVNHVLPGYENVIPGFEWAGIGAVTEVPCRSAAECPEGGWFMLAPKLGEHRRIAMNYPKASTTHHHRPNSEPTMHMHKSAYKARSPVGHKGLVYEKDHEDDGNEREYKLIYRHSRGLTKRSIEARAPCKKKPPKEKPKEFTKIDPNKPLPRLSTVHLLNIEKLSDWKREAIVAALPMMDDEFKMEFLTFQELTPEFIAKLNELYAILLETSDGRRIIEYVKRRPKYVPSTSSKRSVRELSEKEIEKIEALSPAIRQIVAKKLDFDPKLTQELANAEELSDGLIEKLNKEYARVISDPKYAKIIKGFLSKSKRAEPKLTKEMISKIEGLSPATRMMAAKKLGFDPKLTLELANASKFSEDLVEKLNKEWARIASDPKYLKIIEKFVSNSKSKRAEPKLSREMISKVESMSPSMRMMAAEKLDMDPELATEMANAEKFTPELIEKLNNEYARISKDPKYKGLLDKIGFKHKRADKAPELSKTQLAKLQELSPEIRRKAAEKLGLKGKLKTELVDTKKFTPELINKLNKQYAHLYNEYKKNKVIVSKSKRQHVPKPTRKLTDQQLNKISNMSESERRFIAEKLNFEKGLADEFIKSEQFTPHIVSKLNEVYSQIYGGHKYSELVDRFSTNFKRQVSSDSKEKQGEEVSSDQKEADEGKLDPEELKELADKIREKITKELKPDVDLDNEFLYAKRITESFIEKLTDLARDVLVNLKWEEIVEDILDEGDTLEEKKNSDTQKVTENIESSPSTNSTSLPESQLESDQKTTKISEEEPTSNENVEKRDLNEKLEQSKKNGWCDEFLGTLKDTWNESVDEAPIKTEKQED